jgi:hypothetical protein
MSDEEISKVEYKKHFLCSEIILKPLSETSGAAGFIRLLIFPG